jgi:hypothetical protein
LRQRLHLQRDDAPLPRHYQHDDEADHDLHHDLVLVKPWRRAYWLGTVDPRPLALFRIAFAAVVAGDAIDRLRDGLVFYTDAGLFPRARLVELWPELRLDGAAALLGSPSAVAILFAVGLMAALCLGLGLLGRVPAALLWLYLVTLNARSPFVSDGGDNVMTVLAFWLVFAESDAAFSLRRGVRPAAIRAWPVRLLELQLMLIYLVAGARKLNPDWLAGAALFRILQNNDYARPLGMALLDHPSLCRVLTWATLAVELGFTPLALGWPRRGRVVAALAAAGLHVGIYGLMRVGMFSFVMLAALLLFVPLPSPSPSLSGPSWPRRWRVLAIATVTLLALLVASAFLRRHSPPPLQRALAALGLTQGWSMFAHAARREGYWSGQGQFADGTTRDILALAAPALRPQAAARFSRWYKLRDNMSDDPYLRLLVLDWICRQQRSPRLDEAALIRWERDVRDPGAGSHPFRVLWPTRWRCRE